MQTSGQTTRRWGRVWVLGLVLCAGCGLGSLTTVRPPRFIQVAVNYLPYLVKGDRPQFPPARVLVLRPVDKRDPYPVKKGALPASEDNTAILGIWGMNSKEGVVVVNSLRLGAQRRMKAGVANNPDIARGIFTLPGLDLAVQDALASHFHEAGFAVQKANFALPSEAAASREPGYYALGCAIEQFSLVSLLRYNEVRVYTPLHFHTIDMPIRGPTRADVALALTLYHWPSGQVLWEGKVADSVDDPPLGESEFLYPTPGEVLSMALSRAVGSVLVNQSLQDVLLSR
jgi:hypothetical protein